MSHTTFDAVIIGGGINGACLYHHFCKAGYKTLLVEKSDFSGGTSQASAMMIWGGLLYLANLDFAQVFELSFSRDQMIQELQDRVQACDFRYVSSRHSGRNTAWVLAALYLYWILGKARRNLPKLEKSYSELPLLKRDAFRHSLVYQEASLRISDSRFVLQWILPHQNPEQIALNYCSLESGSFDRSQRCWVLNLKDTNSDQELSVKSRLVINAAGVWTDRVNEAFGIESPYKHIFGKGVFIGIKREPQHQVPLIVDGGPLSECLSLIPWGPIALWGPTETEVDSLENAFSADPEDLQFLLTQFNRHFEKKADAGNIVSIRCGVRPLVVRKRFSSRGHTLKISRHHRIYLDTVRPWIAVYGGKITNCTSLARQVLRSVDPYKQLAENLSASKALTEPSWSSFPQLEERIPAAEWCKQNEMCLNLEDYLRRRTNVSQWIERGGLGRHNENLPHLTSLASIFSDHDPVRTKCQIDSYQRKVTEEHDSLLSSL
jgi:glycerol-3-phosphate dehydrogenase